MGRLAQPAAQRGRELIAAVERAVLVLELGQGRRQRRAQRLEQRHHVDLARAGRLPQQAGLARDVERLVHRQRVELPTAAEEGLVELGHVALQAQLRAVRADLLAEVASAVQIAPLPP